MRAIEGGGVGAGSHARQIRRLPQVVGLFLFACTLGFRPPLGCLLIARFHHAMATMTEELMHVIRDTVSGDDTPSLSSVIFEFGFPPVQEAVLSWTEGKVRVRIAQAWNCYDGLPPTTVAEADIILSRIFDQCQSGTIPSPTKGQQGKRARPSSRGQPETAEIAAASSGAGSATLAEKVLQWRKFSHLPFFGFESESALRAVLGAASKKQLQSLALEQGLSSAGSKAALCMDLLVDAKENAARENAVATQRSPPRGGTRGQRQPAWSGGGAARASPPPPSDEFDDSSTSDDEGAVQEALLRSSPHRSRWQRAQSDGSRPPGSAPPLHLRNAILYAHGPRAASKEVATTCKVILQAAQCPTTRDAVERLIAAIRTHWTGGQFPTKARHDAGKYYGDHKVVALMEAPSAWVRDRLSYELRGEDSIGADAVIDSWVGPPELEGPDLMIALDADLLYELGGSNSICGWAESLGGAGGVAAREMWKVFMDWQGWDRLEPEVLRKEIQSRLDFLVARAVGIVALCNEQGLQRLLAKALTMLLAAGALLQAFSSHDPTVWAQLARVWIGDLQSKALVHLFHRGISRHAALLSRELRHGGASVAPPAASPPAPAQTSRRDEGGRSRMRGEQLARGPDRPDTFVWCAVCRSPRHCLWECPTVGRELQRRVRAGTAAQKAAEALAADTKAKYKSKGADYLAAFMTRKGKQASDLLTKLAT